jgi:hypothetical protein
MAKYSRYASDCKTNQRNDTIISNMYLTVHGICLSTMDYHERARIATYFTQEHGRLDVILPQARGKKAKHTGASHLGAVFQLHLKAPRSGASLYRLEQYEAMHVLKPVDTLNYETYQSMMPCLELLKKLGIAFSNDTQKCERIFKQYQAMCQVWEVAGNEAQLLWPMLWFWQGIMSHSGQFSSWSWDIRLQQVIPLGVQVKRLYFHPIEGGMTQINHLVVPSSPQGVVEGSPHGSHQDEDRWPISLGVWKALALLEHLQTEPLKAFATAPQPPLVTLEKLRRVYMLMFDVQDLRLKSI